METKRKSLKQEKRITKSFKQIISDTRMTVGSGNKWFDKADVVNSEYMVEAKTRVKPSKSMVLQKEWFDKLELEAYENKKKAILAFSFGDNTDYAVMKFDELLEIIEELNHYRRGEH